MVPAYLGSPGQNSESRKMVVVVVVSMYIIIPTYFCAVTFHGVYLIVKSSEMLPLFLF